MSSFVTRWILLAYRTGYALGLAAAIAVLTTTPLALVFWNARYPWKLALIAGFLAALVALVFLTHSVRTALLVQLALKHHNPDTRRDAADKISADEARMRILREAQDPTVRCAALRDLHCGCRLRELRVRTALEDQDAEVRHYAADRVVFCGRWSYIPEEMSRDAAAIVVASQDREVRERVIKMVVDPAVLRGVALGDDSAFCRTIAVQTLAEGRQCPDVLAHVAMHDNDAEVRRAASRSLEEWPLAVVADVALNAEDQAFVATALRLLTSRAASQRADLRDLAVAQCSRLASEHRDWEVRVRCMVAVEPDAQRFAALLATIPAGAVASTTDRRLRQIRTLGQKGASMRDEREWLSSLRTSRLITMSETELDLFCAACTGNHVEDKFFADDGALVEKWWRDWSEGDKAVYGLCAIPSPVASNLLILLTELEDMSDTSYTVVGMPRDYPGADGSYGETKVRSMQGRREVASAELLRRGDPHYDSSAYLAAEEAALPDSRRRHGAMGCQPTGTVHDQGEEDCED